MFREIITGQLDKALGEFRGNDSGNAPVMLILGGFKFSLNTAVYQEARRLTSWRWPAQERMGQQDALQYTGPGDDRVELPGIIYPEFRGGWGQIDTLRRLAARGKPLRLMSASGLVLGMWVVESVEEFATVFDPAGRPRKQEFTLTIRSFGRADV